MRSNSQPPQGSVFYSEYRGCHEGSLYQSNRPFSSIDVPPQSQAQRFRSYIAPHHLVHKQNGAIYRDPAALGRCPDANKVTKHHYPSLTATQHPFQGVAAGRPNQGPSYRRVRNRAGAAGPSEIDFVMDHRLMSSSSIATPAPPHPIIFVHPSGAIPSRIRTFGSTPWTPSITVPSTDPNRTKPKFTASSRAAYLKYWNRQSQQQDPACQCCAQKAAAVGASGAQEDCQGADCGSTRIPVRYITADHGTLSHGASHNRAASSSNARKGTSTIKRPNARRRCLSMSDGSMSESNGSHQNTITNVSQSVPVQHSATSEQESASKQGVCPGSVEPGEVHDWIPSKPPIQNDPAQRCRGKSCSHGPCNGVTQSQCRVNHQRPQSMVCKTQTSYDRIASSANQWRAGWRI